MSTKKITKKFIEELEKVIKEKGISQNKLAHSIGYKSGATITNMKSGNTNIKMENLKLFAKLYGYDINFFLEDGEENYDFNISMVREPSVEYQSDKKILDNINNQLETIYSASKTLEQLFETGKKFTEVQQNSIDFLRKLILV